MENKFQIVLYGEGNSGKTSTLMKLVEILCGSTPAIIADIATFLSPSGKYRDASFLINYMGHYIIICTDGDSWAICRENCEIFDQDFNTNITIYRASPAGVVKLTGAQKNALNKTIPDIKLDISVSACSPLKDRYGPIKAIHSYSHMRILDSCTAQFWLRKTKDSDVSISISTMANKIKGYIDDYISGII